VHAKEILNNTECYIWEPSQELLKGTFTNNNKNDYDIKI